MKKKKEEQNKTSRAKHTKRDMSTDSSPELAQPGQSCLSLDRIHDSASDSASNSRLLQQAENLDAIYQAYSRPEVCSTADVESGCLPLARAALARADARNLSDEKLPESHGRDWQFGDSEASFSSTLRSMELQVEASILSDLDSKVAAPPDPKGNSEAQEPQCATHCETTLCGRAATETALKSRKAAGRSSSLNCNLHSPLFEFGEMLNELNQLEEAEMVDGSFANDHFRASLSRADDASQMQPSGRVRRTRLQCPIGHDIESDSDDECATANSYLDTETQFWASNQRRVAYNRWMGGLDLSK